MASDITLDENSLAIETDDRVYVKTKLLIANAWDLHLDAHDRRGESARSRYRRALVHNGQDGLTVNFANDYPAGVTIEGPTKMNGQVNFSDTPTVPDLRVEGIPDTRDISIRDPFGRRGRRTPITLPSSLVEIIKDLRSQIEALEERLQSVERGS